MVLLSPPCPGALLQGTCPKDYKEVSKGAGARLVLEHAGGLQALGPNVVPKGLQRVFFFFLVFYVPFCPLPERGGGLMCHHLSVGTKGLVYSGSVSLSTYLVLAETTESFITPSLQAYPCLRLADHTARRGSRPR